MRLAGLSGVVCAWSMDIGMALRFRLDTCQDFCRIAARQIQMAPFRDRSSVGMKKIARGYLYNSLIISNFAPLKGIECPDVRGNCLILR